MKMMSTSIFCPTSERLVHSPFPATLGESHISERLFVGLPASESVYVIVPGALRANVVRRLNANTVTAAISQIADVGSKDQAERTMP